jgi:hypothetical protein
MELKGTGTEGVHLNHARQGSSTYEEVSWYDDLGYGVVLTVPREFAEWRRWVVNHPNGFFA